jgi:ketosteroid isomerase-like protein
MPVPEEELIERLRRGYEAFNRRDYDAVMQWVHPELVYVSPTALTELRGAEAFRAWMEPDAFESQESEVRSTEVAAHKALIRQMTRARGAGSGIEMEVESWAVWTFDDEGMVTRIEIYLEHEEETARRSFEAG